MCDFAKTTCTFARCEQEKLHVIIHGRFSKRDAAVQLYGYSHERSQNGKEEDVFLITACFIYGRKRSPACIADAVGTSG
jgi:hypothetical protein